MSYRRERQGRCGEGCVKSIPPTPYEEPFSLLFFVFSHLLFSPLSTHLSDLYFSYYKQSHLLAFPPSHLFPKLFRESSQVFFFYCFYLRVAWELAGVIQANTSAKKSIPENHTTVTQSLGSVCLCCLGGDSPR